VETGKAYIVTDIDGQLRDGRDEVIRHARLVLLQRARVVLDLGHERRHEAVMMKANEA
jgi:hypothetical protein